MTTSLADAIAVEQAAVEHGVLFALTHNYSADPMVAEARHQVDSGALGAIRVVTVEYAQGTRNRLLEAEGDAKMAWRVDAAIAGPSTVLGDLGTHAHHLLRRFTGLEIDTLSAELSAVVPGRMADDNAFVNLRFAGGARGQLWSSMVAAGNGHGLRIRVFGEKAGLHWDQERPDELHLRADNAPYRILRRGEAYLCEVARHRSRTKAGNPEGYFGAFGNVYADAAEVISARREGRSGQSTRLLVRDGARRCHRHGLRRGGRGVARERRCLDRRDAGCACLIRDCRDLQPSLTFQILFIVHHCMDKSSC